jgi:CheY-like chemotaxis protein
MTRPLTGLSILIVEDEAIIGMMLTGEISDAGATPVGPVNSVADAMKVVLSRPIDLAVLDAKLVDGSADELGILLQERGIPFVVMSGYEKTILPKALANAPFIAKPVSAPLLLEALVAVATITASRVKATDAAA